ncbi:ATP-binding protein [Streptomyces sp. NPDC002785]|uniref:ATP-binding protein n=1 Tax=Streptomyces sp. NPDC002785 TaxID=3154543 RepID=UPI00332A483C
MSTSKEQFFDARRASVRQAREFATATLTAWGHQEHLENVRLCVSELATNALLHGTRHGHGFLVRIAVEDGAVRLEVHDSREERPHARTPTGTDALGRGLMLVDVLSDGWGVEERVPFGKVIWSCFKTTQC